MSELQRGKAKKVPNGTHSRLPISAALETANQKLTVVCLKRHTREVEVQLLNRIHITSI